MNQLSMDKQAARSELRKQFLLTLNNMNGKEVSLDLYQTKNPVKAKFAGFDCPEIKHFLVTDLSTGLGTIDSAVIRSTDVVSIGFKLDNWYTVQLSTNGG